MLALATGLYPQRTEAEGLHLLYPLQNDVLPDLHTELPPLP